jgi:hypothetical protein
MIVQRYGWEQTDTAAQGSHLRLFRFGSASNQLGLISAPVMGGCVKGLYCGTEEPTTEFKLAPGT